MSNSILISRLSAAVGVLLIFGVLLACTSEEVVPPTSTPPPILVDIGMTANTVMAPVNIDFNANNFTDGATYTWDFGDGNSSIGTQARHTYLDAGTFVVRLSGQRGDETQFAEKSIIVQPGDAGWLILNSQELALEAGKTFQFEAEAFDHLGNPVLDPKLVWHADPAVGSIEQSGLFTAGQDIGFASEGVRVDFTRGNFTANEKLPVSVILGPPTTIAVTPRSIDTRATWDIDISAEVLDPAGHVLEDVEITWEALRPGDGIDQTGHFTPSEAISSTGASLVLVTATDGSTTIEHIVKGTIHPGILDRIEVEGSLTDLKPGDEVQLTARGYDRFGNELELAGLQWEIDDSEAGSFDEDGVFTAGQKSGEFPENTVRVRGFKDDVQIFANVPLSILPSNAVAIEFFNEIDSVPAGSSAPIQVRVIDEGGNQITDVDVYLEVAAGGTLGSANTFRAGFEPGVYEDAVIARILAGDAGNEELLEASTDIEVRERSSDFLAVDIVGPRGAVVYLINLASGDFVPLSAEIERNTFFEDTPSWWPDGSRVAYSSNVNGKREIFDTNPFIGDQRLLVSGENDLFMPAVSPDGTRIAFVELLTDNSQVYVADIHMDENGEMDPDATMENAIQLSTEDDLQHLFPYWSPDGTMIMYTSTPGNDRFRMMVVDVADKFGEPIAEAGAASGLAWHPDGVQVLVATRLVGYGDSGGSALALANLHTGDIEEIEIAGLDIGVAAISPDGSEISFVDDDEGALWLMDIDGTGLRRALGGQYQTTVTAWRPQPLQLPTPTDRDLPGAELIVPDGDIVMERREDATHGSIGPYQVVLETDRGSVKIDLFNHIAPVAVQNFMNLAAAGYYDGVAFHTVEAGSAVFSGSRTDSFGGTAGYYIESEFHPDAKHDAPGIVSMLSKVVDGGSSEFVITLEPKPDWDAFVDGDQKDCDALEDICYAVFGRVIEGIDVLTGFDEIGRLSQSNESPVRILKATVLDGTEQ